MDARVRNCILIGKVDRVRSADGSSVSDGQSCYAQTRARNEAL